MARVIARETDRWLRPELPRPDAGGLVTEPATTGNPHWDALLEGVVAYRCDALGIPRPSWTRRTYLDVGWNPYDDSTRLLAKLDAVARLRSAVRIVRFVVIGDGFKKLVRPFDGPRQLQSPGLGTDFGQLVRDDHPARDHDR